MPENSGDQSDSSPTPAASQPSQGHSASMSRQPRSKQPVVVIPKEAPPGFHEFITLLANIFSGSPTDQSDQQTLPKKQKFQRRQASASPEGDGAEETLEGKTGTEPGTGATAKTGRTETTPSSPLPGTKYTDGVFTAARMRKSKPPSLRKAYLVFAWQLLAVALVIGSFVLGRATVSKVPIKPLVEPSAAGKEEKQAAISKLETLQLVDQAMAAEANGDPAKGLELLQKIFDAGVHLTGLDYHMALLAYESEDSPRVLPLLNRSIAAGEEVANCYNLRGTMANRRGGITKGLSDLETATEVDPFDANHLFFLGEAQRRSGRPQAAVNTLQRALDRQRDQNLAELYQLKIRLAQIEAGQEANFSGELAAQLANNRPALNWLFTAAALEMHRGNFAAAAGYLDKAHERADDLTMTSRLRDFYFVGFAREKLLERFFVGITFAQPASTPVPPPAAAPTAASPMSPLATP